MFDLGRTPLRTECRLIIEGFRFKCKALFAHRSGEGLLKSFFHIGHGDAVLRAFGPGQRRHDRIKVQLEYFGKFRVGCGRISEERLFTTVRFSTFDHTLRSSG